MAILDIYVKFQRGPVDLREMKIVQSTLFTQNPEKVPIFYLKNGNPEP